VGIPGYYGIARAEEKILIQKFGEQYVTYQKEVGMFLPKVR
jgi:protein-S-isoprenylcysteine O-methyltransferase Ste14